VPRTANTGEVSVSISIVSHVFNVDIEHLDIVITVSSLEGMYIKSLRTDIAALELSREYA